MARSKKIDAPILVIGLGGTGFDALMRIKHEFYQRFETEVFQDGSRGERPPRTEYLEIDTDQATQNIRKYGMKLQDGEFLYIGGNLKALHAALKEKPYISEWVDDNISTLNVDGDGAGQCRQVSRLFLFNSYQNVYSKIFGKLNTLNQVAAGALTRTKRIEVKIVAGISGGTGSGTLLDMAYIIREIARNMPCDVNIEAYLIMPDVTIQYAAKGNPTMANIFRTNAYGLLKELDCWMDAPTSGIRMEQQYTDTNKVAWEGRPFNDVYFLCAQNDNGTAILDAYNHDIGVIAEYLVKCYESSNDTGNENFSVENSKDQGAMNQGNSFSFQSARSNQNAIIDQMTQPYPVPYCYHTLGAFSNAGEDRQMELQEWSMIYKEVMERIDAHPVEMTGVAPVDFCKAILGVDVANNTTAGQVRAAYNKRHPTPDLSAEAFELRTLKDTADNAAPHGDMYQQFDTQLGFSHGDEVGKLTNDVWDVFATEAARVAMDVDRGPKYLLDLLQQGTNSLGAKLDDYIDSIDNKYRNADGMKEPHLTHANEKFRQFREVSWLVGLVKNQDYYNNYIMETGMLYDATRAAAFYGALHEALKKFKTKLAKFTAVLSNVVAAIVEQKQTMEKELAGTTAASVLFDMKVVNQNLMAIFAQQEQKDTFVRSMYENAYRISLRCMGEDITSEMLPEVLDAAMDQMRENAFISVGGLSISQKITLCTQIQDGPSMQAYAQRTLCPRLETGATTMFSPDALHSGLGGNDAVRTCVISVPAGETNIIAGIQAYCNAQNITAIIKLSSTTDRIFWVNDKGGMPMYFYGQLDMLQQAYNALKTTHKGYHLFMRDTDAIDAIGMKDEMKQNWATILPDPITLRAVKETDPNAPALKAAEEAGVLKLGINFTMNQEPVLKAEKHILQRINGVAISRSTIENALGPEIDVTELKQLKAMDSDRVNLQNGLGQLQAEHNRVTGMLNGAVVQTLVISHAKDKAIAWSNLFGTNNRMIPLNPAMDDATMASIKDAWTEAYGRVVREALGRRPDLVAELKMQTECMDLIHQRIRRLEGDMQALQQQIASIKTVNATDIAGQAKYVARMLMYGLIELYPASVKAHVLDGEEETDLFTNTTEMPELQDVYPDYKRYPMLLRLAGWFGMVCNDNRVCELLLQKEEKHSAVLNKKKHADDAVRACYSAAQKLLEDLAKSKSRVAKAYLDGTLSDESNAFCGKLVQAMQDEANAFLYAWQEEIEG